MIDRTILRESAERLIGLIIDNADDDDIVEELLTMSTGFGDDDDDSDGVRRVDIRVGASDGVDVQQATAMTMLFISWMEEDRERHKLLPKDRSITYYDMQRIMQEYGVGSGK